jgi:histidinol phosphatase-like PHP family hydrolase
MIDLHTHTFFSDGELVPSELVRRAHHKGYTAIGIADHVDHSNIDFVVPRLVAVAKVLSRRWDILVVPGAELTHVPLEELGPLTKLARKLCAEIVIGHGETISEPVLTGTNRKAIEAGVDILAHPGLITKADAELAEKRGVCLEITTRKLHATTNAHVVRMARDAGALLIVNTDGHCEDDLITTHQAMQLLKSLDLSDGEAGATLANAKDLLQRKKLL